MKKSFVYKAIGLVITAAELAATTHDFGGNIKTEDPMGTLYSPQIVVSTGSYQGEWTNQYVTVSFRLRSRGNNIDTNSYKVSLVPYEGFIPVKGRADNFSYTIYRSGRFSVIGSVADVRGNVSLSEPISVLIDNTPPDINIVDGAKFTYPHDPPNLIFYDRESGIQSAMLNGQPIAGFTGPFVPGAYTFTATDGANNAATVHFTVSGEKDPRK